MPTWLQIFLSVLMIMYVPAGAWIVVRLIEVEKEIAKINERCSGRQRWTEGIEDIAQKTHSNVIKIAAKLNVDIKE